MEMIDKAAVVAWAKETYLCENASMTRKVCYKQLLEYLDTLEVKEVCFKHELEYFLYIINDDSLTHQDKVEVLRDKIKERLKNM